VRGAALIEETLAWVRTGAIRAEMPDVVARAREDELKALPRDRVQRFQAAFGGEAGLRLLLDFAEMTVLAGSVNHALPPDRMLPDALIRQGRAMVFAMIVNHLDAFEVHHRSPTDERPERDPEPEPFDPAGLIAGR
jgi:hypothetical protein